MPIYIPNAAEERMLDLILAVNYTLRLYKTTDVTAGLTDAQIEALTVGNFTEANFTGYVAKALIGGSWVTTQADPTTGTYAPQTFTSTANQAAQVVYGYYVTRTSDNALMWFERFTGPLTVSLLNDAINVTPTITLDDTQEATVAARGLVASQILVANSPGYVATGVSDMTLAGVTVDVTRNYRVDLLAVWFLNVAALWYAHLTVDGIQVAQIGETSNAARGLIGSSVLWQPATGSYNLAIYLTQVTGGTTWAFFGGATFPRQFWVEDIGPR